MKTIVHKFGGSSVADAECIKNVCNIISEQTKQADRTVVVFSAYKGVTNQLEDLVLNGVTSSKIDTIRKKQIGVITDLLGDHKELKEKVENDLKNIELRVSSIKGDYSREDYDFVTGFGEYWSNRCISAYLNKLNFENEFVDSRDIITTSEIEIGQIVNWDTSNKKFSSRSKDFTKNLLVFPGYVCCDTNGTPATLKRNGSDFSAAIMANLFNALEVIIWTDVSGMLTVDPKLYPAPAKIDHLSYEEALELAFFGAKVIFPKAIEPAFAKNIKLRIKNTFKPNDEGTLVYSEKTEKGSPVKGIAAIENISIVSIEGVGMMGVVGLAERVFSTLSKNKISAIMISQASSEYSISFAVNSSDSSTAKRVLEEEFSEAITSNQIKRVSVEESCCIVSIVGDDMVSTKGVSSCFFSSLALSHVNIKMIAQGSLERNISVVISKEDMKKAISILHAAFFNTEPALSIGVVGAGLVGDTLLKQIHSQSEWLASKMGVDFKLFGVCTSKKMVFSDETNQNNWRDFININGEDLNLKYFIDKLSQVHMPHKVLIDCTASDDVANLYSYALEKNIHIITPNKKAGAEDLSRYEKIMKIVYNQQNLTANPNFLYETTVGAGLPIIDTLQNLIRTGDEITKIEGVFSGTLSYIFNNLNENTKFSDIVKDAKAKGFTEPDPREDLSGMDVARKVVILARESGVKAELSKLDLGGIINPKLFEIDSVDEFLTELPKYDDEMKDKVLSEKAKGNVLRYVGVFESSGKFSSELKGYPASHPLATLNGPENMILFHTKRYSTYPLIVRGPGAGADVTAAGVFGELIKLAQSLKVN
jgi:aspartokinase/homoserine dehydrogenase 1